MATINLGRVKGDKGDAATLSLGTVSTGAAGSNAAITNTGTAGAATFNFTIPRGDKGEVGNTGPANTLSIASVTTGEAGSTASVSVGGDAPSQTLTFTIPRGDKGETGLKGDTGNAATISLGAVSTGAAGSNASITNTGTSGAAVFNFAIPRGDKGDKGDIGNTGPEPSLTIADNSATAITLADTDNNRVVRCTASSAVTITVPSTLAAGFSCMIIQAGTGRVTFVAGSGATINSFGNLLATAGQHAPASLMRVASGVYNLSGNLI